MTPARARADAPVIHDNGCYAHHKDTAAPDPEDCTFGFFDGDTVVLYGDSHAAQWFGAAVEVADTPRLAPAAGDQGGLPARRRARVRREQRRRVHRVHRMARQRHAT